MSFNAFRDAKADEVQHQENLGDICEETISLVSIKYRCRIMHRTDDGRVVRHTCMVNDDSGKVVELSWQ